MRARNLKPGFFKNPELADAGPHAQLLFAGLWLMADKEGRLKDQPRLIKAELFPYYDVDVNGELTVIQRLGYIHRFVSSGIAVIEVCNFKKHQSPHHTERPSDLPGFDGNSSVREIHGEVTVKSPLDDGGNPSDSLIPDSSIKRGGRTPRKAVQTELAADFILTAELRTYLAKTLPDADAPALFEKFCDQARAKSWTYTDWARAFQGYCRNAHKESGHFAANQYPKLPGSADKWV